MKRLLVVVLVTTLLYGALPAPAHAAPTEYSPRIVYSETMRLEPGAMAWTETRCPDGERATGGGATGGYGATNVVWSAIMDGGAAWGVGVQNTASGRTTAHGWVVCVRGITTSQTAGDQQSVTGPNGSLKARAGCPLGEVLLGGGVRSGLSDAVSLSKNTWDSIYGIQPWRWESEVYNRGSAAHAFQPWAACSAGGLTSVRYVTGETITLPPAGVDDTGTVCPPHTFILAGGHSSNAGDQLLSSWPTSGVSWRVVVRNNSPTSSSVIVPYAVCGSVEVFWNEWAEGANVRPLAGDVNGDQRADLMMVRGEGWTAQPVALSGGGGSFTVRSWKVDARWPEYAQITERGGQPLQGDFNGDGRADLTFVGAAWASGIPIAFAGAAEDFQYVSKTLLKQWRQWSMAPNVKPVIGDFDGDGKDDVALAGGAGWTTLPIAYSNGDGTFRETNLPVDPSWARWAGDPGVKLSAGDFDNDGRDDLALTGGAGWQSVPVAFASADGTFRVANKVFGSSWPQWAATANVRTLAGDFNKDGRADLALVGGPGWQSVPIALSTGDGSFTELNQPIDSRWNNWVTTAGAEPVVGDFNGDRAADLALVGGTGWQSQPVAFNTGNGTFTLTNEVQN